MPKVKGKYKFGVGEPVKANDKAPGDYRGRVGVVVLRGPGKCEYGVQFDGDARGVGFLGSWCLDRAVKESGHLAIEILPMARWSDGSIPL